MRILLDECVPQQVRHALPDHEVATAQGMGWKGLGNGQFLDAAVQAGLVALRVYSKGLC
jgi:hypothetical protein